MKNKENIFCIMGPTAVGKTDLALKIAEKYPVEIISVDSALVYRDMTIGTAKPTKAEQEAVKHHLIDILDPAQAYSAAQFREDALQIIDSIEKNGNIPLLVGGTMLYFKALFDGLAPMPSADPAIRAEIAIRAEKEGWAAIYHELQHVDPASASRIKPTDTQRLQRALEVYQLTGTPMSEWWEKSESTPINKNIHKISIIPRDRAYLHDRIKKRFELMLQRGFINEVEQLYSRTDLHSGLPSIRCVGYRQVWGYLSGELEYNDMLERGIIATRQLAKRQMTWLRSMDNVHQFYCEDADTHNLIMTLIAKKLS